MSQENVDVVWRWVETYNRRDIDGLLELSDEDIEFRSIFATLETGGVFRGTLRSPRLLQDTGRCLRAV